MLLGTSRLWLAATVLLGFGESYRCSGQVGTQNLCTLEPSGTERLHKREQDSRLSETATQLFGNTPLPRNGSLGKAELESPGVLRCTAGQARVVRSETEESLRV